jgi:membrane-bound lytic murein transglycosylase C
MKTTAGISTMLVANVLMWVGTPPALAQETYQEFLRQQQQGMQEQQQAFAQYQAEVTAEYQQFYEQQQREFQNYLDQIASQWGEKNAATTTKKDWVSYDKDFGARRQVDFESGQVKVEVLVDKSQSQDQEYVRKRLQEAVAKAVTDKGTEDPLEAKEKSPPRERPLLSGQVQTKDGKPVTETNAKQYAGQLLASVKLKGQEIVGRDGKSRIAYAVQFPLVPSHVRIRAAEFRSLVQQVAQKSRVSAALVFAVIHTESWFNPKARSWAPAYGLMQLVPKSGARAAYMHIYGKDQLVTPEYLYQPQNNVQLGVGYLDLLMNWDFKDVKYERCRMYCAVSAYNTGPGNVAKAFVGERNVSRAIARINSMSPEEVFKHLKANLPYQETREYVVKVTERMPLYHEWGELR